jgi:capsular polysaccharide biosynthesis protein
MNKNDYEYEIDFSQIIGSIRKLLLPILIICLSTAILSLLATTFFIDKQYKAAGKLIVVQSLSQDQSQLSYNDIVISQKLVDTYTQILLSDRIGDLVIDEVDSEFTTEDYKKLLKVSSVNDTEVISVAIETLDPELSANIVNITLEVFKEEVSSIMSIENVSILTEAKVPVNPSSPSIAKNTIIGLLIGILISGGLVLYNILKNNFVKDEEELMALLGLPVIGIIPDHDQRMEDEDE